MSKIYAFESRAAMVEHMERIARRIVKHFFSDFTEYDVKTVQEAEKNSSYIWILRNSGTYLLKADSYESVFSVLSCMDNASAYVLTFGRLSDTVQKLDLDELETKYKRLAKEAKEEREKQALFCVA